MDGGDGGMQNLLLSVWQTLAMIRQVFGEESMSHTQVLEGHVQTQHFLWHQGDFSQRICPGRPNSQFYILLWCFTVTAWNEQRLLPELWWQKNWLLHHDNAPSHTSFFTREFLTKTTWLTSPTHTTCLTMPPVTSVCFPYFWCNWGDRGRIVGTLTEHNFQDACKKWQKRWEQWCAEWATLRAMVAGRPRVSVWQDGSTSPGNYGYKW
jgi:hypothetical protein